MARRRRRRSRLNNNEDTIAASRTIPTGIQAVEKASPSQLIQSPSFLGLSEMLSGPRRGTRELLKTYADSPWLRAVFNKIAKAVAETRWQLFSTENESGKAFRDDALIGLSAEELSKQIKVRIQEGQGTEILSHPLLDLINNGTGSARLPGISCMQVTQTHLDLVGEAYWLKERNSLGVPFAYWPIPPSWIYGLPLETEPFYQITTAGGLTARIPVTEIVAFVDPDPSNPYGRGVGIAKALDDEIAIDEHAAKHMKAFFLNRARPDIIISGQFISKSDAERLEKKWMADHQGFWKAFKPLFFSQKIDIKELSHNFENLQMVQVRKNERDTFISVVGSPPEKFGIIGESKRSTISAADLFWQKDVIRPRDEMIKRVIQQQLVPDFDERLIFSYFSPVIADSEFELSVMKAAPYTFTVNQWQQKANQPGFGPAGDVLPVPLNTQLVPVTSDGKPLETPQAVAEEALKGIRSRQVDDVDSDTIAQVVSSVLLDELGSLLEDKLPKASSQ